MSSEETTPQEKEENAWHPLPGMIGDMILAERGEVVTCGGYIVEKDVDGWLLIYETTEVAGTEEELSGSEDQRFWIGDGVYGAIQIGSIEAPDDGWESELQTLPEEIWGGFE